MTIPSNEPAEDFGGRPIGLGPEIFPGTAYSAWPQTVQ